MKSPYLAIFLGVVMLVLIGVLVFVPGKKHTETPVVPEEQTVLAPEVTWATSDAGEDEMGTPQTKVSLVVNGKLYDAGTYAGSCSEVAAENLTENEVSAMLCWFAGGGEEIGVFKEGEAYVVKKGVQDEGSAEAPGFRGKFETLLTL